MRLTSADDLDPRDAGVACFDGTTQTCDLIDLPFYDPDKRIPRGLDTPVV